MLFQFRNSVTTDPFQDISYRKPNVIKFLAKLFNDKELEFLRRKLTTPVKRGKVADTPSYRAMERIFDLSNKQTLHRRNVYMQLHSSRRKVKN